jgi:uncharacterized protein (TIGR00255 family)
MTGYGRGEAQNQGWTYTLQIKSVNNRFLEAPLKLPSAFWAFESEARALLQKSVGRGKLDLNWKESPPKEAAGRVAVDLELAWEYKRALEKLSEGLALTGEIRLDQLARFPEVIRQGEEATPELNQSRWQGFKAALELALKDLQLSREREGAALGKELDTLLKQALKFVNEIEKKSSELAPLFSEKLKKRLEQILAGALKDESRLAQEAAMLVDKADIREEIVRFKAHGEEFSRLLKEGGAVGKKLDFLCQELLREANTMGSKSPDAGLTQAVVALKSEIEKLKEQIQNLE